MRAGEIACAPRARLAADALAANVPDLQRDRLFAELHPVDEEIEPNRLLITRAELVVTEARRDRGLPDGAVAEEDHLELVDLDVVLVAVVGLLRAHRAAARALVLRVVGRAADLATEGALRAHVGEAVALLGLRQADPGV